MAPIVVATLVLTARMAIGTDTSLTPLPYRGTLTATDRVEASVGISLKLVVGSALVVGNSGTEASPLSSVGRMVRRASTLDARILI